MRAGWWEFWERPGVVDRAAGTNTTPAEGGLGDGVLMETTGALDRAGSRHHYTTCRVWAGWWGLEGEARNHLFSSMASSTGPES